MKSRLECPRPLLCTGIKCAPEGKASDFSLVQEDPKDEWESTGKGERRVAWGGGHSACKGPVLRVAGKMG